MQVVFVFAKTGALGLHVLQLQLIFWAAGVVQLALEVVPVGVVLSVCFYSPPLVSLRPLP